MFYHVSFLVLGLLVELSEIEVEFLSFQDVTIASAGLAGSGGDLSQ